MKDHTKYLFILFLLFFMTSCSKKAETMEGNATEEEWPEMDSFHMLMAEAFHPYKDSSNLEPARKLAAELSLEADNWRAAPLPEKADTETMKGLLEALNTSSHRLADQITKGATDQEIGESLTELHDSFHKITEAWHGGGEKHDH